MALRKTLAPQVDISRAGDQRGTIIAMMDGKMRIERWRGYRYL
jgi:hypothetical protein